MPDRGTKLIAAVLISILAAACGRGGGGSGGAQGGEGELTGSISADGSSTVFPITQAVAETFQEQAPDVKISVGTSGTGGGFEKFCNGETDIADASRQMEEQEKQACAAKGVEFVELQVALDGLSVVVNPRNNFAKCLTVEELKKIWAPNSQVEEWSQVREGFPSRPIKLYGPGTDSGTFDYFTEEIVGEEGASRNDYIASEDDNVLVQGIAGDQNALGYFGYAYYIQNKDKLKTVALDSGSGCVQPTEKTIESGEYSPLSRPLFIYVSKKAAAREEVKSFVDFYLAEVKGLLGDVGYLPSPEEVMEKERQEWKSFAAQA